MAVDRVAVLGIGNMGAAMARRLSERGFEVVLYNRTFERAATLADEIGARAVSSPAEAAAAAEVLITMVADDDALRQLCTAEDGILAGARQDSVTVQTSTVLPDTVRELGRTFAGRGLAFLDAPVSGSTTTAASGELTLMIGGAREDLERARPVLETIGTRIFELGPVGAAAALKLAVNDVILALDVALSEALVLAEAAGVDRAAAYDVFAGGAAGAPFVQYKRAAFVEPGVAPPAFSFELAQKDMSLILALAERSGVPMRQAETNMALLSAAASALGADRDFSEVAAHIRSQRLQQKEEASHG
jgi:3-hydroxyisobutyrate dehydrogenase-like beta-hydroxyacid dehydrogenase